MIPGAYQCEEGDLNPTYCLDPLGSLGFAKKIPGQPVGTRPIGLTVSNIRSAGAPVAWRPMAQVADSASRDRPKSGSKRHRGRRNTRCNDVRHGTHRRVPPPPRPRAGTDPVRRTLVVDVAPRLARAPSRPERRGLIGTA